MVSFVACAKVEKVTQQTVNAEIESVNYKKEWLQPIMVQKNLIYVTHPAEYYVTLKYTDVETTINDWQLYHLCKEKVGTHIKCTLITTYYSNEKVKKELRWECE